MTRVHRGIVGKAAIVAGVIAATAGCSQATAEQWGRWGLPESNTAQAHFVGDLWSGAWIASMVIGVFVWGLIFYAMIRFRRRSDDDAPRQSQYNLPMEIMYTIIPFLIIGVLFYYTVRAQDGVLEQSDNPDYTVHVIAQKWSWTFNYMATDVDGVNEVVYDTGTIEQMSDLYLPVNAKVRFVLDSADVIHSFWVPEFYTKLDAIPGHTNSFEVTPTKTGDYLGKCAELCGEFHARMLFNLHVVSEDDFIKHLQELKQQGNVGEIVPPAAITAVPVPSSKESGR